MARKTYLLTVNNVGDRETITVNSWCRRVWLQESPDPGQTTNWPTTQFETSDLATGGNSTAYVAGSKTEAFVARNGKLFAPNQVLGYIALIPATPAASAVFQQIEDESDS